MEMKRNEKECVVVCAVQRFSRRSALVQSPALAENDFGYKTINEITRRKGAKRAESASRCNLCLG